MMAMDHGALKLGNQLLILNTLREKGPMSRKLLKEETGLAWGTITSFVKEMLGMNLLVETGKNRSEVGRKPVGIDLNITTRVVVGVRLGGTYIKSIVLDLRGKVIGEHKTNVNPNDEKEAIVKQIVETIDSALDHLNIRNEHLVGIGFAAPGAIDTDNGVCLYAPRHPKWKDVPIKKILQERYLTPCFVEHSNSSSALGEQWFGAGKNISDFLCVPIGTGISVGIIVNGHVYRGYNRMAGEFGHASIDPDGVECICGRKGCMEEYASGRSLARQAAGIVKRKRSGGDKPEAEITSETLYEAARSGDRKAQEVFESMGQHLGIGLANLINILNPELIIISGGVSKASQFFLPALENALVKHAWDFSSRKIAVSGLEDPVLLGAASLVLREIYMNGLLFRQK